MGRRLAEHWIAVASPVVLLVAWEVAAASFSKEKLRLASGQRLIVGTLQRHGREGVHVFYGIEDYYVREGKGNPPRGKMEAEVALTADGTPLLTQLLVNGRPYP